MQQEENKECEVMVKSLIIIKPGFLQYTNNVLSAFENLGYTVTEQKTTTITQEQCDIIWSDLKQVCEEGLYHMNIEYYNEYCDYIKSDEVKCIVIENETGNYSDIWITKNELRKVYQVSGYRDLLHTSDSNELAQTEIECIFV